MNVIFSEVHRIMNAMGPVQKLTWLPLLGTWLIAVNRLLIEEIPQKNEIHLLYLHFILTSLLFIVCESLN